MTQEQSRNHEQQGASSLSISRRQFLKRMGILGGGIVVYFNVGDPDAWARMKREGFLSGRIPTDYNAFLRIGIDGRVTCFTGKIEMGQGPITSLPQMLAEELDVGYDVVDLVMGDTDLCPWDVGTFGSLSTRHFGIVFREAAGEAKGVLKELASDFLKCPVDRLGTKDGVVYDNTRPEHKVTYAQLAKGKPIERHLEDAPPLKPPAEYSVMGRSYLRQDSGDKVTGRAKYAGDIRLPDMLYAVILRPPAHGAKLKSVDVSQAKLMKDVRVVQDGDFTAVLHQYPDVAEKALSKIKAEFDLPETGLDHETIFNHLVAVAPKGTASEIGDLETGKKLATDILEETYLNSYVAHAPMETHTAVAAFEKGKCTVWASTQTPFSTRERIAGVLGLAPEKVRMITPFVGGGFGGKGYPGDQAVEAARLAKITGRPVQVAWSREEEFFFDTFRPAAVVRIKSGTNGEGRIVYWDYSVFFAGERGSEHFYDIPHHRTISRGEWMRTEPGVHPFAVGAWRAPGNNTNTYAREFHIHMMAAKAGMDPLEFRLKNLKDQRMIRVLKAAAEKFGRRASKEPGGRGFGISCAIDAGTYVAHMAEVDVDKNTGKIQVNRVVCVQDMGFVVNPEGAKIQMEGCITMGLGYALTEEVRFKDGRISDLNFDSYELPRFSWLPEIETAFVDNVDLPPQGGGEPAIVGMGAVLASAVFDGTGAKLFQLPMTPERVKKALGKV